MSRYIHIITILLVLAMLIGSLAPVIVSAVVVSTTYSTILSTSGVIEKDRKDYMNADGNPLKEDIANAVFQGSGEFGSDTVGFMKDIYIDVTNYGTLPKINYTGEEVPPYHWLPVIEQNPVGSVTPRAPVEGWALYYNLTVYPTTLPKDAGQLVVTTSGYSGGWRINVVGQDANDNWVINPYHEIWVDNPRLQVVYFNITAQNLGSPYKPVFSIEIVVIFNKATKFVEIYQKATLLSIDLTGCISAEMNMALARMAIIDANPYCDRAFYGWKNVTISDPEEFFIVLSWTNNTLYRWVRADLGYDYYAVYALAYPIPDAFAIASTWYDSNDPGNLPDAADIWSAPQLRYTTDYGTSYVFLYMGDIDGDGRGDGDQALVRFEWYKDTGTVLPEYLPGTSTGWKMVMYGVYDVNGNRYDGGEGGYFAKGYLMLSNGIDYNAGGVLPVGLRTDGLNPVPNPWPHTGTLGYLNTWNPGIINEAMLYKLVKYLDIDQDGNKDRAEDADGDPTSAAGEYNIPYSWWPTEELLWQLRFKFAPPVFCKNLECGSGYCYRGVVADFIVVPSPGATPDAAGSAWLNGAFTAWLVTFDVEAYNMTATVGYTNPANKMMPYLMLRLEPIPTTVEMYRDVEWKSGRVGHYLTDDLRALPQMEWTYRDETQWRDVHYFAISVAGIHPNLLTFYANDFSPIVRPIGGDYGPWYLVVLPTIGPVSISPYVGGYMGAGVIALARDHFNNTYLLVYGTDAQDTYWTSWFAVFGWDQVPEDAVCSQAILIEIDYTAIGNSWGDGSGIPIAHPNYPWVNNQPVFNVLYYTIEHGNLDGDWTCECLEG